MTKVLALLVAAACALPVAIDAQVGDSAKMLQMFSSNARAEWGNLQVIVLNDKTIEVLFGASPAKAAFRTKARMATVFFVQGKATKDFQFKNEAAVNQKGETFEGKVTLMKNFAEGKVPRGEQVQALVEVPAKVDLYEPFKVTVSGASVEFRLDGDDLREHGNR